ncbi:MAG: T3SS effector HopA1 family protein [Thermomicrobiales bacterium]
MSSNVQEHVRPIFRIRPDAARGHLGGTLTNRLYEDFYQAGRARPSRAPYAGSTRANGLPEFVDELSAANAGNGTRQAGWLLVEHRDGDDGGVELAIRRDGLTLRAKPEEIVFGGDGLPGVGEEVDLKLPKELPAISPGFYTVLSDEPYDAADLVVRVYWNLYSWGAATLVQGITGRLNGAKVPFRLKVVNHPDRYNRCDAGVLYLLKDDLDRAVPLLAEVYREVRDDLKRPVPALTKRIAPGVGLAEDPPGGDSFGMHRCRLLAEGLVRGWEQGAETVEDRLAVVIETFEEAGIDPERPYLNPVRSMITILRLTRRTAGRHGTALPVPGSADG